MRSYLNMRKKLDKNGKEIRESSNTSFINVIRGNCKNRKEASGLHNHA